MDPSPTHTTTCRPTSSLARFLVLLTLFAAILPGVGCSKRETFAVTGKVTFNGEPVSNGEIQLLPADQNGPPAAAVINGGEYRLLARPGAKRVSIRAARQAGAAPKGALGASFEDYIPAEFNSQSTLTADVAPRNDNQLDFHLQTGGKR